MTRSRGGNNPFSSGSPEASRFQECRDRILHAAIGCFEKKGIHATSMADIARATPMSVGNLYNYFEGKEEIILELGMNEMARFQAEAEEFMTSDESKVREHVKADVLRNLSPRRAQVTVDFFSESMRNGRLLEILRQVDAEKRKLLLRIRRQTNPNETQEEAEIQVEINLALMDGLLMRILVNPKLNLEGVSSKIASCLLRDWGYQQGGDKEIA